MKKQTVITLTGIIAIVAVAMLGGCVEKETQVSMPTSSPVVMPTQTPLHEPKYSRGDIVQEKNQKYPDVAHLILDYSPDADNYKRTGIFKVNGVWLHRSEDERWLSREFIEDDDIKVGHVDVSKVMSWEEYWDRGGHEKAHATPTSTPSKAGRGHSVITFSGSTDKTTPPFTIKGDEWRVKWSIKGNPDYTYFFVYVYPRGQTRGSVSNWSCAKSPCSDTQYIYEGAGNYYFKIGAANLNSWKLEVEDYY